MAATNKSKAEKEREKVVQDKCQAILSGMLKDEDNKYCVDCDSKGPRWASWNMGVFLCIRCAGIHRNLGVHISKVKSVNLDSWTPQQVASMQSMGNSRGRAVYEANLPDDFRRPNNDSAMEAFIRNKYEKKKFIAKEWVATKPPDLPAGWHDLSDQEKSSKTKEVKKIAAVAPPVQSVQSAVSVPRVEQQAAVSPAVGGRTAAAAVATTAAATSSDLLGLGVGSSQTQQSLVDDDLLGFSAFVSASPVVSNAELLNQNPPVDNNNLSEVDFFNQVSSSGPSVGSTNGPVDSSKMSKDSILALFGSRPTSNPGLATTTATSGLYGAPAPALGHLPGAGLAPAANGNQSALLLGLGAGISSPLQQQLPHQAMFLPPGRSPLLVGGQQLQQQQPHFQGYHPLPPPQQQLFPQPPVNPMTLNNPFLEASSAPGAGSGQQPHKMINTLPQNVFQINNQLSGLSLNPSPGGGSLAPSLWQ